MNPRLIIHSLIVIIFTLFFCHLAQADEADLVWSTFQGEGYGERGFGIAVDDSGYVYVTGETWSADFPSTAGAFDMTHNSAADAFVTKFNPSGSALVYSTFIGGAENDAGNDITVDYSSNVYVT